MDPIDFGVGFAFIIGSVGLVGFLAMLGRAALKRAAGAPQVEDAEELRALQEAVERLSAEVADLHERLEFAERLLASQREPERLERSGR